MKNFISKILPIIIFAMTACSSNDDAPKDQLPPATTSGANTAGCYIGGELLIPKDNIPNIGSPTSFGLQRYNGVNFGSTNGDDYYAVQITNRRDAHGDYIYIHIPSLINGVNEYPIGQSNGQLFIDSPNNTHVIVHTFDGVNLGKTYYSGANAGIVTITRFDFSNRIVSGVFNLTVYNVENSAETIEITQGRFDINGFTINQ